MNQQICPACTSESFKELTKLLLLIGSGKLSTVILECVKCKHRFMPTTEAQQQLIEAHYDSDYSGYRPDPYFAKVIRRVMQNDVAPRLAFSSRILDVGCGNGEFLKAAQEQGFTVEGIDISESAIKFCEQSGISARSGNYLSLPFTTRYNMITMWDVIEHLREPELYYSAIR